MAARGGETGEGRIVKRGGVRPGFALVRPLVRPGLNGNRECPTPYRVRTPASEAHRSSRRWSWDLGGRPGRVVDGPHTARPWLRPAVRGLSVSTSLGVPE